jgi:hypothetical protein
MSSPRVGKGGTGGRIGGLDSGGSSPGGVPSGIPVPFGIPAALPTITQALTRNFNPRLSWSRSLTRTRTALDHSQPFQFRRELCILNYLNFQSLLKAIFHRRTRFITITRLTHMSLTRHSALRSLPAHSVLFTAIPRLLARRRDKSFPKDCTPRPFPTQFKIPQTNTTSGDYSGKPVPIQK